MGISNQLTDNSFAWSN